MKKNELLDNRQSDVKDTFYVEELENRFEMAADGNINLLCWVMYV